MVVRKKGNKWYCRFQLDGFRYEKACKGATSQKEATIFESILKADIMRGDLRMLEKKQKITFGKLTEIFLDYSKGNKDTWKQDEYFCKKYLEYFNKNQLINEIKPLDIEGYKTWRQKSTYEVPESYINDAGEEAIRKIKIKIKESTINRELNSLRKIFSLAVENDFIEKSPCKNIKILKTENTKIRFLSREEEKTLFEHLKGHWLEPIVFTALKTGMRREEILTLKWGNVDFKAKFINLLKTKNGKARKIPISPKLKEKLQSIKNESEFVFINSKTKTKYSSITKTYNEILEKAKIENFTFHDLRHTAATRMIEGGYDLVTTAEILGHSDLRMVGIYAHTDFERKRKAIEYLDNF